MSGKCALMVKYETDWAKVIEKICSEQVMNIGKTDKIHVLIHMLQSYYPKLVFPINFVQLIFYSKPSTYMWSYSV